MDGPDFFRKAYRISAYTGVMKMRAMEQMSEENPQTGSPSFAAARSRRSEDDIRHVTSSQMFVGHSELFELGVGG